MMFSLLTPNLRRKRMIALLLAGLAAGWLTAVWVAGRKLAARMERPDPAHLIRLAEIDLLREIERRTRGRKRFAREWAEARRRLEELGSS